MEYLKQILGIEVQYQEGTSGRVLPNYLNSRYAFKETELCDAKAVFVYPQDELEPMDALKKHLRQIETVLGAKAVLVFERLTYRQREHLLRDHIPFIVEGKQIYLPFLAVYLQQRCDAETQKKESLSPAAQVLLLHYIYHGCGELKTSEAAKALAFTPMSISRASKELEEIGVIKTKRKGVEKILFCGKKPQELFLEVGPYWLNPAKRTVYVSKEEIGDDLLLGGYSALSHLTMLNPPRVICYASGSISKWEKIASPTLLDENEQCALELWRYNPKRLSTSGAVDPLSLALALREDKDERVEDALKEMLEQTWRDIDGTRD